MFPDGNSRVFRNGVRERRGSHVAHSTQAVFSPTSQVLCIGGPSGVGIFPFPRNHISVRIVRLVTDCFLMPRSGILNLIIFS